VPLPPADTTARRDQLLRTRRAAGPSRPRRAHGRRHPARKRLRDRRGVRLTAAALVVVLAWFSWSMGQALTRPGGGSVSERAAEWARDHYLGPLVTFGEWITYQPPKVGGRPSFSLAGPGIAPAVAQRGRAHARPRRHAPKRLASLAGRPLPGEGKWRVLYRVHHVPAVYGTFLRPDRVHTSYVAGVVSMNPRLLRFQLRPGTEDPGPGRWGPAQPVIAAGHRRGLAATFNGGFKIASAEGGFYLNGAYRGSLRPGAASMVYYRNGRLAIGTWGRGGLRMNRNVAGVRQNLRPIVEAGRIPPTIDQNVQANWGATLGGGYYVWRSGVGVTASGRIIFAYGPALDARTLADLLQRAGCVEAMELDINPEWTNFMYYRPGQHPGSPKPVSLLPGQMQPAGRYYAPTSRDFTAVFAR
jgi:hypothetical protein